MPKISEGFPQEILESPEKRTGENVRLKIEFMRHEEPGKTPEGMSADYLTEKGKRKAAAKALKIQKPYVKGYASPKLRAQATVDLPLQNVFSGLTDILNKKLEASASKGTKTVGQIAKGQNPENTFNIRLRPELDTAKNFSAIMPEAKQWAEEQIASGSKRSAYDLMIQYYLDHPERCQELGVSTPEESAEEIAFAASREIGMTKRLYNESEVHLLNATHGPKLEPFLQRVMVGSNGKTGFESLEEIGGALNPGEGFEFNTHADSQGEQTVTIFFRDQIYQVDLEKLEELSESYSRRLKEQKK